MIDVKELSMNYARVNIWPRTHTKKNPYELAIGFVCSSEDLGTFSRSGQHKGINTNILLASRPFTAEEVTQNEKSYRLRFVYYKDWEALIVDEYRVTEDADWIEKLITISRSKLTVPQVIIKAIMNRS